jgi:hypothetical protein
MVEILQLLRSRHCRLATVSTEVCSRLLPAYDLSAALLLLRALPSDGRCSQSHRLATGLHDTIEVS